MGGYVINGHSPLNSAEIFLTKKPQVGSCPVGNLNQARYFPTMCHNMVCGGGGQRRKNAENSCEKFDGKFRFTSLPVRLVQKRIYHLCWGLKSGDVLLLGGYTSSSSTERVSADGSSSSLDFKLPYKTR